MDGKRVKQSALWAMVMLNMAFADIVGFLHPGTLQSILDGAGGFAPTPGLLLGFSVLVEVPIAMVFLSLVLAPTALRRASLAAAAVTTAFIVGGGSANPSYVFFAAVEIGVMVLVVLYAWGPARKRPAVRQTPM